PPRAGRPSSPRRRVRPTPTSSRCEVVSTSSSAGDPANSLVPERNRIAPAKHFFVIGATQWAENQIANRPASASRVRKQRGHARRTANPTDKMVYLPPPPSTANTHPVRWHVLVRLSECTREQQPGKVYTRVDRQ